MTEQTPTPEQHTAWKRLNEPTGSAGTYRLEDIRVLASLLPESLTGLPSKAGLFIDRTGGIWRLDEDGDWYYGIDTPSRVPQQDCAPFTPLIPDPTKGAR